MRVQPRWIQEVCIQQEEGMTLRQYAILRERQETAHKEFQQIIEYMNGKQRRLLATIERKQKLMRGALEEVREKLDQ